MDNEKGRNGIYSEMLVASDFFELCSVVLKSIVDNLISDYAVFWIVFDNKTNLLCPSQWIFPLDISSFTYYPGEGIVGYSFEQQCVSHIANLRNSSDKKTLNYCRGVDVSSVICFPITVKGKKIGCIELLKEKGDYDDKNIRKIQIILSDMCDIIEKHSLVSLINYQTINNDKNILISASNIHKSFINGNEFNQVLKGIDLDIYEGEFLCILGESGCGKSTMLNILGGLLSFDEGSLRFSGKELKGASKEKLTEYRRVNVGFIFQSYNLMPNLNVYDNLSLISELSNDPMNITEALEKVGLSDKARVFPSKLSGGQQQRVAIARALVKKPKLILADEPTAALDYSTSIEVLSVLEKVVKKGTTLVMVTHNEEITKMANRVVRLRDGKVSEIIANNYPLSAHELVW